MPAPISTSLSALKAYNRPDQNKKAQRPDEKAQIQTPASRRLSPALSVQLSAEAQKILASNPAPQKTVSVETARPAEHVGSLSHYDKGVGRREAPLNEPTTQKAERYMRPGSTLDIKV